MYGIYGNLKLKILCETGTWLHILNGGSSSNTHGAVFVGVNGTCIIGGVVRGCSDFDMTTAAHDIVLVRGISF